MRRHGPALFVATILVALALDVRADIYRWVDDTGAVHYATERDAVPSAYRDAAQLIQKPPTRRARRPSAPAPSAPAPSAPAMAPEPAPSAPAAAPSPAEPPPAPIGVAPAPAPPGASAPPSTPPPSGAGPTSALPGPATPLPGPPGVRALEPDDPRAEEVAALEAQIAKDRETLRQMISTKRWDSSELANDPQIREVAERLPRLQAELEALRREPVP